MLIRGRTGPGIKVVCVGFKASAPLPFIASLFISLNKSSRWNRTVNPNICHLEFALWLSVAYALLM